MVLVFEFEQLLRAFLCRGGCRDSEDLFWLVVDCQNGGMYTGCKGLCFLVITFLFGRSFIIPLIPLLRMAPVRKVILLCVCERRRLLLASFLHVAPLLDCLAIDAHARTLFVGLPAFGRSVLRLQFRA